MLLSILLLALLLQQRTQPTEAYKNSYSETSDNNNAAGIVVNNGKSNHNVGYSFAQIFQKHSQRQQQNQPLITYITTSTTSSDGSKPYGVSVAAPMEPAIVYDAVVPKHDENTGSSANTRTKTATTSTAIKANASQNVETSKKVIGSSVVTSVSVILNGDEPQFTNALGQKVPKPQPSLQVASPIDLLNPDRYEFYTFNDNGDLVKRLMTMQEIQSIVANGDGEGPSIIHTASINERDPEKNVQDIVDSVHDVLNKEVTSTKNTSDILPMLDTPDVSSSWSMILPAIFGNIGGNIISQLKPQQIVMTPDTDLLEIPTKATTIVSTKRPKPTKLKPGQKRKPASTTTTTITTTTTTTEMTPQVIQEELDPMESVYTGLQQYQNLAVTMQDFNTFSDMQMQPIYQKLPISTARPETTTRRIFINNKEQVQTIINNATNSERPIVGNANLPKKPGNVNYKVQQSNRIKKPSGNLNSTRRPTGSSNKQKIKKKASTTTTTTTTPAAMPLSSTTTVFTTAMTAPLAITTPEPPSATTVLQSIISTTTKKKRRKPTRQSASNDSNTNNKPIKIKRRPSLRPSITIATTTATPTATTNDLISAASAHHQDATLLHQQHFISTAKPNRQRPYTRPTVAHKKPTTTTALPPTSTPSLTTTAIISLPTTTITTESPSTAVKITTALTTTAKPGSISENRNPVHRPIVDKPSHQRPIYHKQPIHYKPLDDEIIPDIVIGDATKQENFDLISSVPTKTVITTTKQPTTTTTTTTPVLIMEHIPSYPVPTINLQQKHQTIPKINDSTQLKNTSLPSLATIQQQLQQQPSTTSQLNPDMNTMASMNKILQSLTQDESIKMNEKNDEFNLVGQTTDSQIEDNVYNNILNVEHYNGSTLSTIPSSDISNSITPSVFVPEATESTSTEQETTISNESDETSPVIVITSRPQYYVVTKEPDLLITYTQTEPTEISVIESQETEKSTDAQNYNRITSMPLLTQKYPGKPLSDDTHKINIASVTEISMESLPQTDSAATDDIIIEGSTEMLAYKFDKENAIPEVDSDSNLRLPVTSPPQAMDSPTEYIENTTENLLQIADMTQHLNPEVLQMADNISMDEFPTQAATIASTLVDGATTLNSDIFANSNETKGEIDYLISDVLQQISNPEEHKTVQTYQPIMEDSNRLANFAQLNTTFLIKSQQEAANTLDFQKLTENTTEILVTGNSETALKTPVIKLEPTAASLEHKEITLLYGKEGESLKPLKQTLFESKNKENEGIMEILQGEQQKHEGNVTVTEIFDDIVEKSSESVNTETATNIIGKEAPVATTTSSTLDEENLAHTESMTILSDTKQQSTNILLPTMSDEINLKNIGNFEYSTKPSITMMSFDEMATDNPSNNPSDSKKSETENVNNENEMPQILTNAYREEETPSRIQNAEHVEETTNAKITENSTNARITENFTELPNSPQFVALSLLNKQEQIAETTITENIIKSAEHSTNADLGKPNISENIEDNLLNSAELQPQYTSYTQTMNEAKSNQTKEGLSTSTEKVAEVPIDMSIFSDSVTDKSEMNTITTEFEKGDVIKISEEPAEESTEGINLKEEDPYVKLGEATNTVVRPLKPLLINNGDNNTTIGHLSQTYDSNNQMAQNKQKTKPLSTIPHEVENAQSEGNLTGSQQIIRPTANIQQAIEDEEDDFDQQPSSTTVSTTTATTKRVNTLKPVSYYVQPTLFASYNQIAPPKATTYAAGNIVAASQQRPMQRPASLTNLMAASTQATRPPVKLEPSPEHSKGLEASTDHLDEDLKSFSYLCNELAFSYWKSITSEKISSARSLIISPFALTSMLSMVFLGARGGTSGEMNEVLKLDDMITFNPHLIFKNITESVEKATDSDIATTAYVREIFSDRANGKILPFFKEKTQQWYSGHVEEVNFMVVNDIIRRRTNLLVKRHTMGKVLEYLRTNSVWVNGPLATVSANLFQTDCTRGLTHDRDGEMFFQVHPTVRQRRLVPIPAVLYRSGFTAGYEPKLDATVVAFGRIQDTVSTIYVMPGHQSSISPTDNLDRLERDLVEFAFSQNAWSNLLTALMDRPSLEVQLPRFSHRSFVNATLGLQKMGLKSLFKSDFADLRGLTSAGNREPYLSDMIQINTFSTCGEEKISDHHHVEMYPAPPLRKRNKDVATADDESYDSSEAIIDFGSLVQESALGRGFYDDLLDPKYLELPLPLRPRQARVPDAPRLRFDKPFLYFVRHNPTGMILFMGRFNPRLLP